MIDTDKYEGHLLSEGEQVWCWSNWMLKNAETREQHEATAALLNAAPLLLEEVKRLREFEEAVIGAWHYTIENKRAITYVLDDLGYLTHTSGGLGRYHVNEKWLSIAEAWVKKKWGEEE